MVNLFSCSAFSTISRIPFCLSAAGPNWRRPQDCLCWHSSDGGWVSSSWCVFCHTKQCGFYWCLWQTLYCVKIMSSLSTSPMIIVMVIHFTKLFLHVYMFCVNKFYMFYVKKCFLLSHTFLFEGLDEISCKSYLWVTAGILAKQLTRGTTFV